MHVCVSAHTCRLKHSAETPRQTEYKASDVWGRVTLQAVLWPPQTHMCISTHTCRLSVFSWKPKTDRQTDRKIERQGGRPKINVIDQEVDCASLFRREASSHIHRIPQNFGDQKRRWGRKQPWRMEREPRVALYVTRRYSWPLSFMRCTFEDLPARQDLWVNRRSVPAAFAVYAGCRMLKNSSWLMQPPDKLKHKRAALCLHSGCWLFRQINGISGFC